MILSRNPKGRYILARERAPNDLAWRSAISRARHAGFTYNNRNGNWSTGSIFAAMELADIADADTAAFLAAEQEIMTRRLELSRATVDYLPIPHPEGETYFPFQHAAIRYMTEADNVLLGDEMGLGKGVTVPGYINLMAHWFEEGQNMLVLCAASLKPQWRSELRKWLVQPWNIHIVNAPDQPPMLELIMGGQIVIMNYDILHRHETWLSQFPWVLVAADEAHRWKNPTARRTQSGYRAIANARKKIFMTGTPIPNRAIDIFNLVHNLAPQYFPTRTEFIREFCNGDPSQAASPVMLNRLQERLRSTVMVRRLEEDVNLQLPSITEKILLLEAPSGVIEEERRQLAKHAEEVAKLKAAIADMGSTDKKAIARAAFTLRTMEGGFDGEFMRIRHETALKKLPLVINHIQTVLDESHRKIIVGAWHRDVIEGIRDAFPETTVLHYGGMSPQARFDNVERFNRDPKIRILCASEATAEGYTANAADLMLIIEYPFRPGDIAQLKKRFHRIGQDKPVLVLHVVLEESIDAEMAQQLVVKQGVIDLALDETEEQYLEAIAAGDPDASVVSLVQPAEVVPLHERIQPALDLEPGEWNHLRPPKEFGGNQ